MEIVIIILLFILILMASLIIFKLFNNNSNYLQGYIENNQDKLMEKLNTILTTVEIGNNTNNQNQQYLRKEISEYLDNMKKSQSDIFIQMMRQQQESQNMITSSMKESLLNMMDLNQNKLNDIQNAVNEKLDKSLNDRLDSNFKQISEQLNDLYKSLGELNKLSTGVGDLNKTLSNVKTRGIWGEVQLQSILEQTMTTNQYDTNIPMKNNSNERVEFAIKIPSKDEDNQFIYLPIDSKFPSDIYNKIVSASENADSIALTAATKELEQRIKTEARTIRDKYIDPPNTTDFAVMFLPTESLFSEVLRINGLSEWCQTNCHIIISGPTTITALLNSLRVGFSNLALNKKSKDVLKLLQTVKTQYETLNTLIDKTQKKLNEAVSSTEELKNRTQIIQRKMSKIEIMDTQTEIDCLIDESDY